jgi:ABC-type hemin transport system substrate-binding protein
VKAILLHLGEKQSIVAKTMSSVEPA